MSIARSRLQDDDPSAQPPAPAPPGARFLWLEVLGVLVAVMAPGMYYNLAGLFVGEPWSLPVRDSIYTSLWQALECAGATGLILYVIARSGEGWSRFGIVRPRPIGDVAAGLLLLLLGIGIVAFIARLLPADYPLCEDWPRGPVAVLVWGVTCLIIGLEEEILFRGYLFVRLERLLDSPEMALVVTAGVFGANHLYQGWSGVVGAAAFGLLYGVAFIAGGRIWPLVLGHTLHNFILVFY